MPETPRANVNRALKGIGFRRDDASDKDDRYVGPINVHGTQVEVSVEIFDWEFISLPTIRLTRDDPRLPFGSPHIEPGLGICYSGGARAPVLDRYQPGGTVLTCVEMAREVLEDIITGKLSADVQQEFFAYWQNRSGFESIYWDFPDGLNGLCPYLDVPVEGDRGFKLISNNEKLRPYFLEIAMQRGAKDPPKEQNALVVYSEAAATTFADGWPPETYAEIVSWLSRLDPDASKFVSKNIASACIARRSRKVSFHIDPLIVIRFKNDVFAFQVLIPSAAKNAADAATKRRTIGQFLKANASSLEILRFSGKPISWRAVVTRNLLGNKPLSDQKILLIGCGTIGGYFSELLVQAGAGTGHRGRLTLVDNDRFEPGNIGRHLLSYSALQLFKAEACANKLCADFPESKIEAYNSDARAAFSSFDQFDVVIDATGEEALSLAINHHILQLATKPAAIYVWLEGNGAVVGGLIYSGEESACYRCLRPRLDKEGRYKLLLNNSQTVTREVEACGNAAYTPYSVASSVSAAALGLEMVLDWVNDHPTPKFRSRILRDVNKQARKQADIDISKSGDCPACG